MNKTVTICDECGVGKGETNHWFLLTYKIKGPIGEELRGIGITNWSVYAAGNEEIKHLCGEACATKAFQKWLSEVERKKS